MSAPKPMKLHEYIHNKIVNELSESEVRTLWSDDVQMWIHDWYNLHGHICPLTFESPFEITTKSPAVQSGVDPLLIEMLDRLTGKNKKRRKR
tara:strand:+ start:431 stop:706 length:276 start_codon:yes stop_codon:yes gene_type:complete